MEIEGRRWSFCFDPMSGGGTNTQTSNRHHKTYEMVIGRLILLRPGHFGLQLLNFLLDSSTVRHVEIIAAMRRIREVPMIYSVCVCVAVQGRVVVVVESDCSEAAPGVGSLTTMNALLGELVCKRSRRRCCSTKPDVVWM